MKQMIKAQVTHMTESTRRGYSPDDRRDFSGAAIQKLRRAGDELYFLLNRGYPAKGASALIGNHHLLSERQRVALTRVVSAQADIDKRKQNRLTRAPCPARRCTSTAST